MFIAQAFYALHDWWRYAVGIIVVFVVSQLASIPFLFFAVYEKMQEGGKLEDFSDTESLMTVLDSNLTLFLMLLPFVAGFFGLFYILQYLHKQPLVQATTSRKKIDWGRFAFGFGLIAITTIVITGIDFYTNPQNYVVQFDAVPFLIMLAIAVVLLPLQTSFEEYLFRGYLMQGIGVLAKNKWVPLLLTSVVFGLMHFANPEVEKLGPILMVYYIGTGLLLGIMTLMDEGLELALGFHAGNNLIAAVLVTADWTVFQTNSILKDISEPSAGVDILLPVLVMYPIFLLIMAKRFGWKNWGDKLFGKVIKPEIPEHELKITRSEKKEI